MQAALALVILLLAAGVPIGLALLGAAAVLSVFDQVLANPSGLFRSFFSFLNSYTLMAVPFFIFAGFLMERTGIVEKLFEFADALIGWLPGGFAYAVLLAAVLFGAISGSSTAMAAAMGVIAYPEMIRRGYPVWMSTGIIAGAAGIALLIPPSLSLILFGIITESSIVRLFFAGAVPGLMLALSNAVIIVGMSIFIKLPAGAFSWSKLAATTWSAGPALMMPAAILGGLYGGIFTPTEAGAAACFLAMAYGIVKDHKTFFRDLLPTARRAANLSGIVFLLVGCVGVFQFVLANEGWPQDMANWVGSLGLDKFWFLVLVMVVMLTLSMFLTGVAILVLTVPIFYPVALSLGVDPVHLGILTALAIEMGGTIPPVGLTLFAVAGTTGVPVSKVIKGTVPFLITDGFVLVLVLIFPALALWLPDLMVQSAF